MKQQKMILVSLLSCPSVFSLRQVLAHLNYMTRDNWIGCSLELQPYWSETHTDTLVQPKTIQYILLTIRFFFFVTKKMRTQESTIRTLMTLSNILLEILGGISQTLF